MRYKAVYKISFKGTNRFYIGSTSNTQERRGEHLRLLRRKEHANPIVQNVFDKYGEQSFIFEIIEQLPENFNGDDIKKAEQKWLDLYYDNQNLCMNILSEATSSKGRKVSEETKRKISFALKGRKIHPNTLARLKDRTKNPFAKSGKDHPAYGIPMPEHVKAILRNAVVGRPRSEEHRKNLGKAHKGFRHSEQSKQKMSLSRRDGNCNNTKKVYQYSLDGQLIKCWNYMTKAAKETNTNLAVMSMCCHGHYKTANGFIWSFVELNTLIS
jgi:group I intron endonuclease